MPDILPPPVDRLSARLLLKIYRAVPQEDRYALLTWALSEEAADLLLRTLGGALGAAERAGAAEHPPKQPAEGESATPAPRAAAAASDQGKRVDGFQPLETPATDVPDWSVLFDRPDDAPVWPFAAPRTKKRRQ